MRVLLELLRIIIVFALLGAIMWLFVSSFYNIWEYSHDNDWIGGLGIYLFLFVLYRNKIQFSGWYKGKGRKKLPPKVSKTFLIISIALILSPPLISLLLA